MALRTSVGSFTFRILQVLTEPGSPQGEPWLSGNSWPSGRVNQRRVLMRTVGVKTITLTSDLRQHYFERGPQCGLACSTHLDSTCWALLAVRAGQIQYGVSTLGLASAGIVVKVPAGFNTITAAGLVYL